MQCNWRKLWMAGKVVIALAIVIGVGWQFGQSLDNPELWQKPLPFRSGWLLGSAGLYILGLCCAAGFWFTLLRLLGEPVRPAVALRAYGIAQLGKYIPGKAVSLLLRATLLPGVRPQVAILTAIYETLTTMSAGALLAILLLLAGSAEPASAWQAAALLALAGIPILPVVFNPLAGRLTRWANRVASRLRPESEAAELPRLRSPTLLLGLGMTAFCWCFFGLSLWAMIQAILPQQPDWSWADWGRYTAYLALAYVAGFLAVPAPGGLGVREVMLQQLLTPEFSRFLPASEAASLAVVVVLLLRLCWIAAELLLAGCVFWVPPATRQREPELFQAGSVPAA